MANSRLEGTICSLSQIQAMRDGVGARTEYPLPGPLCNQRPSGLVGYMASIKNVANAIMLGVERYAYRETVNKLDEDIKLLIDGIWPGLVDAFRIYAISIASGAVVLGGIGAVLGEGVGAVPGALLGARLGAVIGTGILTLMGLKFLVEYVIEHFSKASKHFKRGYELAWNACGDHPPLDPAAREFGMGIANLVSLILQAAVAYMLKKGYKTGSKAFESSKMGRTLLPYAKVQYWREKLGLTDAKVPRAGIATALDFFETQMKLKNLKDIPEKDILGYLKAMDFSKTVKQTTLRKGQELIGYRDPASGGFGYFYTEVGNAMQRLGIDTKTVRPLPEGYSGPGNLVDRGFFRFRINQDVVVLESYASGVKAWDTLKPVSGGAKQYFIPKSWDVLEIIQRPNP